ncbi:hypothetical protein HDV00_008852 [Rhizophlyctis rosea]|nr:hypothetical protein HDV00_008852 [Rhizophlyctis rosea]
MGSGTSKNQEKQPTSFTSASTSALDTTASAAPTIKASKPHHPGKEPNSNDKKHSKGKYQTARGKKEEKWESEDDESEDEADRFLNELREGDGEGEVREDMVVRGRAVGKDGSGGKDRKGQTGGGEEGGEGRGTKASARDLDSHNSDTEDVSSRVALDQDDEAFMAEILKETEFVVGDRG